MSFPTKRFTRVDVGIAFAQLMEEVHLAEHPTADRWSIRPSSAGYHYELSYTEGSFDHIKQAKIGRTAREAVHYLEAMRDGMMIIRKMREEGSGGKTNA